MAQDDTRGRDLEIGTDASCRDGQCGIMDMLGPRSVLSEHGPALDPIRSTGPRPTLPGLCPHPREPRDRLDRSEAADHNSFEQWQEDGALDAARRVNGIWMQTPSQHAQPPLDPIADTAVAGAIGRRRAARPDSDV